MVIIALWITASLLLGFLGRKRRGGFWAIFFFSMVLSPLVVGLALLLMRPKPRRRAVAVRVGQSPIPAEPDPIAGWLPRLTFPTLIIAWSAVVLIFAFIYWKAGMSQMAGEPGSQILSFGSALELSIDMATLGFNVESATTLSPLLMA